MKKMMLLTIAMLSWCHVACPMDLFKNQLIKTLNDQLIKAVNSGSIGRVRILLNPALRQLGLSADLNQADKWGYTPLTEAIYLDNKDIVKLLLYSGADPNQENRLGYTPLVWAIANDNKDVVKLLLDLGADPNQEDKKGNIALIKAIYLDNKDIVKLLLYSGADPNLKNSDNKTAFDYDSKGYIKSLTEDMIREFTTFLEGSESYGLPEDMLVEIGRKTLPFANDQQIRNMIGSVKRIIDTKK